MSTALDHVAPTDLGERLRIARERAGVTQAAAAVAAGMARTTLVAIEQGQRRARLNELLELAKLYNTSVNALLRREATHVDLIPRFRKLGLRTDSSVERASRLLTDLVQAEVELENLLGVQRVRNYPQQRPILRGDVQLQAEQDAMDLRQWLGLGLSPVPDMVTLLDLQLGVRVFVRKLAGRVSGLFAYDEAVGACMLLNANHPLTRRNQTAAHETGHLLASRGDAEGTAGRRPGAGARGTLRECVCSRLSDPGTGCHAAMPPDHRRSVTPDPATRHCAGPYVRCVTRGNRPKAGRA